MLAIRVGNHSRRALVAGIGVFALLTLGACGSNPGGNRTVTLVSPPRTGGQANVAVAKHILERELGYKVVVRELTEKEGWKAIGEGRADAVLENWELPGRTEKYIEGYVERYVEKYVEKEETVVPGGPLGVTGRIGWYVPRYLADEVREVTRWENLNKHVDMFRTRDSGDKGVLFQGDPSSESHDEALIRNLDLNYELQYLGSEEAQLEHIRQWAGKKQPFLTYWWTPHWVEAEVELVEVRLPEHYLGCDKPEEEVECGYPATELRKYLNADFADNGGQAAQFLKNFEWSEEEQNTVAKMIAGDGLSPADAAEKWARDHENVWKKWLWGLEDMDG